MLSGEMNEVKLRDGLLKIAEEYSIDDSETILNERFSIGQRLPRYWPDFDERNVYVTKKSDNYIIFNAECLCNAPDHRIEIIVDKSDNADDGAEAKLFAKCYWHDGYDSDSFWKLAWNRIKAAFSVLVRGELEVSGEFLFHGKKHLRTFVSALESAADHVEKNSNFKSSKQD